MARKKVILVDADVISHFIATGKIDTLPQILSPHTLYIVEQVYKEASYHPFFENRKEELDSWMARCHIQKLLFPKSNRNILLEYYRLRKENPRFGEGERACMAIACFDKEVIASSNFRDVATYCKEHDIEYIGVMDILLIAMRKGVFDESECNKFIHDAIVINKAKFPVSEIGTYKPDRNLDGF